MKRVKKQDRTGGTEDLPARPRASLLTSRLFRKYFFLLAAMILITTSLSGILMMRLVSGYFRRSELEDMEHTTAQIADTAKDLFESSSDVLETQNAMRLVCFMLKSYSDTFEADVFIANPDGTVAVCKELMDPENPLVENNVCSIHSKENISRENIEKILNGERKSWLGDLSDSVNRSDLLAEQFISASPIRLQTADGGTSDMGIVFMVRGNAANIRATIASLRTQFFISVAFSGVVAFAIIYIIIYRFSRPFEEIIYATRLYSKGDFSYRIRMPKKQDEISELISAFNSMANDLSAFENSRRNFVANVSHELKTPMTTIGGYIDGILDGTISPSDQKKYLRVVSDEVKRLARLISSMLNMSKIEAGELTPSFAKFDLSEMVVRTLLSFEQIISKQGIDVVGLDSLEKTEISADPDMINQVIYNIIDNAVKFTPRGNKIEVRIFREADRAVVKIRNYGVGIANEELKMVFDRFYKVDKSRSLNTKSVGLGLYICKSIVELHKGRIYAASSGNEYSEFTVELPTEQ